MPKEQFERLIAPARPCQARKAAVKVARKPARARHDLRPSMVVKGSPPVLSKLSRETGQSPAVKAKFCCGEFRAGTIQQDIQVRASGNLKAISAELFGMPH
jgi:hypothetical protein